MIKSYSVSLRISKFYSAVLFLQGKPVNTPDPGVYDLIIATELFQPNNI
jgi:hypothetical protein